MEELTAAALAAAVVLVLLGLVWLGWRGRLRRQGSYAPLPAVPDVLSPEQTQVEGQYVVTTSAGDWLDRIAVHSLGVKSTAVLGVHSEGVLLRRTGAADVFLPAGGLTAVRLESGMAGKFVEKNGLVVLTWMLGDTAVDTAFRTRLAEDKAPLLARLKTLVPAERHPEIEDRQ